MIGRGLIAPVRLAARAVRAVGVARVACFGAGAVAGALVTPVPGRELRRRVAVAIAKRRSGSEPTVEERVREHLASSPRTWHLPQPEVVAVPGEGEIGWRIILAGTAPDEAARVDLEAAAASVVGVNDVDNRIRVPDAGESPTEEI